MFGLSGSSSKSRSTGQSQSSSFSFGASDSVQGSRSSSLSGGSSVGGSESRAGSKSRQSIAFEDVFAKLYGNAEDTAANLDPSLLTDASNQLFAGGTDFLSSIGGDVGSAFLENRLSGDSGVLDAQMGQLQSDIGDLFREELLPGITSEAVGAGQLGGGRQGVAQGKALDAASDAFTAGAVDLRARDQAQLDSIASGVAGRTIQGAEAGIAGLAPLAGVAEMGFGADLAGMERLAAILGGPTTLTQQESASTGTSFSNAMDFARAFSDSFGRSSSRDRAGSQSSSRTESSSTSKSLGLKFI